MLPDVKADIVAFQGGGGMRGGAEDHEFLKQLFGPLVEILQKGEEDGIQIEFTNKEGTRETFTSVSGATKEKEEIEAAEKKIGDLYEAIKTEKVEEALKLIAEADDLTGQDEDGNTALIIACKTGKLEIVTALLEQGAAVDATSTEGDTPLMEASKLSHTKVMEKLLEWKANLNAQNGKGQTALWIAATMNQLNAVELLLNKKAKMELLDSENQNSALMNAVQKGNADIVNILLNHGANPNVTNKDSNTALMVASFHGYEPIVKLLLEKKVNIYKENKNKQTAISIARDQGQTNILALFEATTEKAPDTLAKESKIKIQKELENNPKVAAAVKNTIQLKAAMEKASATLTAARNKLNTVKIRVAETEFSKATEIFENGLTDEIQTKKIVISEILTKYTEKKDTTEREAAFAERTQETTIQRHKNKLDDVEEAKQNVIAASGDKTAKKVAERKLLEAEGALETETKLIPTVSATAKKTKIAAATAIAELNEVTEMAKSIDQELVKRAEKAANNVAKGRRTITLPKGPKPPKRITPLPETDNEDEEGEEDAATVAATTAAAASAAAATPVTPPVAADAAAVPNTPPAEPKKRSILNKVKGLFRKSPAQKQANAAKAAKAARIAKLAETKAMVNYTKEELQGLQEGISTPEEIAAVRKKGMNLLISEAKLELEIFKNDAATPEEIAAAENRLKKLMIKEAKLEIELLTDGSKKIAAEDKLKKLINTDIQTSTNSSSIRTGGKRRTQRKRRSRTKSR
jgi:ankyrin repeat protein